MSDKEFSLYAEEEKIISRANEFIGLEEINNVQQLQTEYKSLLDNYKKLFKQSKRLIRMSDKMEAELAITKAELEKYSKKLQMQATTDTLTGLANRRKITELLKEEIKKLEEDNNNNFNIIMLDIDFFKKVNDNYGHPMGDEVIKKVSNHMQDKVGSEGVVGRFGGEEVLTILYNNNIQEAALLANQIRSDIESKKIEFEGNNEDLELSIYTEVYEDLSKEDRDRYEYIFPSYNLTKYIESSLNGELSFVSNGSSKLYDTNVYEKLVTNDLKYQSYKNIIANGFVTNYELLLKNSNSDGKNSQNSKNELDQNLQSIIKYQIQYPLKKEGVKFDKVLTPIFSARFSPNKSKNIKGEDRVIDYNNIFTLNRIGSEETVEGGHSITIGNEFKTTNKLGNELFSLNLASVFRDEENLDLPEKSTLDRKSSNIVGEMLFKPKEFFDLKYNFSLDNDMETLNYNLIDATFSINNFVTSFEFLEEDNYLNENSYLVNKSKYKFSDNYSVAFETSKNLDKNITDYYNLIYEYENDCLTAAIEYNKNYYTDGTMKPEENFLFSIKIIPFGKINSPSIAK